MFEKLKALAARLDELEMRLSAPDLYDDPERAARLLRERNELEPIVTAFREYEQAQRTLDDATEMLSDPDMKELAEQEQTDIGNAKESFDILNRIIEENAAIAQTVMDKTKNLEALKLDIINSVSELSAISEENAASNEEVTARVTEIAESVNRISEDTQTVRKVSSDMKELMGYFK